MQYILLSYFLLGAGAMLAMLWAYPPRTSAEWAAAVICFLFWPVTVITFSRNLTGR